METLRLKQIQQPSRVERLLEAFVWRSGIVTEGAWQIRDSGAVPAGMRPVIGRAIRQGLAWSCWANLGHVRLFTCDLLLERSRERGAPILRVDRYGEDGTLEESGTWTTDSLGKWIPCTG